MHERELRNSHIVPEFLYGDLYNEKGHMMAINGLGTKGWSPLQKGLREPLFCEQCEQHFNEYCEKPFRRMWVDSSAMPLAWPADDQVVIHVKYASFKLFHLSVLFRASVSSLGTFAEVKLGPHEERLRRMLLEREPGVPSEYPIMGIALLEPKTRAPMQMVCMPVQTRFEGLRCYSFVYGGVNWWLAASSRANPQWLSCAVNESGALPMLSMSWKELGLMQQASQVLNSRCLTLRSS